MKHKKLFISLTAVFTVILALTIFLMIWFWGDSYKSGNGYDGFGDFSAEFEIPGLDEGACPQGIGNYRARYTVKDENGEPVLDSAGKEQTDKQNYFFISAYFKDKPSRLYVVGQTTGLVGYVTLKDVDGEDFYGHVGGVATNGYTLWVASGKNVYVARKGLSSTNNIAYDVIKAAEENGELQFTSSFDANCNAAFCYYYDYNNNPEDASSYYDKLYVGEFYRSGNYETDRLHHFTTPNGEENKAFVYEYSVETTASGNEYGLTKLSGEVNLQAPKVQKVFSIPNEIQGFARVSTYHGKSDEKYDEKNDGLVLSQSYGLKKSKIYYYSWSNILDTRKSYKDLEYTFEKDGKEETKKLDGFSYNGIYNLTTSGNQGAPYKDTGTLYAYFVDSSALNNVYAIPSMSEGLCVVNDKVYVLFESGAYKYKTFVRQILNNVYSFVPRNKRSA